MKILIITDNHQFGGIWTFVRRLVDIHTRNGHSTAIALKEPGVLQVSGMISNSPDISFHRVRLHNITPTPTIKSILSEANHFQRTVNNIGPDLVIIANCTPWSDLGGLLISKPLLFWIHTSPYLIQRSIGYHLVSWLLRHRTSPKRLVVAVSDFALNRVHQILKVPPSHCTRVYNTYRPELETIPTQGFTNQDESVVLTAGHLEQWKQPGIFIETAKKVIRALPRPVRFIWLGSGSLLNQCRQLVNDEGLADQILFPGYIETIDDYYRTASVYFQPSKVESHGIAILEAMMHALPVVASNVGGIPESI